jgi:hypothetical protein
MNYIKKLEAQVTDLKENQVQVETMLTELLAYLTLDKFTSSMENNYVNAQEMKGRIYEIRNAINAG